MVEVGKESPSWDLGESRQSSVGLPPEISLPSTDGRLWGRRHSRTRVPAEWERVGRQAPLPCTKNNQAHIAIESSDGLQSYPDITSPPLVLDFEIAALFPLAVTTSRHVDARERTARMGRRTQESPSAQVKAGRHPRSAGVPFVASTAKLQGKAALAALSHHPTTGNLAL